MSIELNSKAPSSQATLAIETRGLTKRFGDFVAVEDFDLEVPSGSVMSLLGPNGAGKTTIVRMLATLLRPDAGTAKVDGYDVVRQPDAVRRSISLTGQFAALDPNLTARENIVLMARLRGRDRQAANSLAGELLERFDAVDFADRLAKQLSGGQRRRVDLAASLIEKPSLLVLDEPTTGLDPRSRQVVWDTVRALVADGITLLLTTQYLEEADALSERIVMIDAGVEIAAGTPAELKAKVGGRKIDIVLTDAIALPSLADALAAAGYEPIMTAESRTVSVPASDELKDLARVTDVAVGVAAEVEEVALRSPTLDDAFLTLTGHTAEASEHRRGARQTTTDEES